MRCYNGKGGWSEVALSPKDQTAMDTFTELGKKVTMIAFIETAVRLTFDDGSTLEFDAVGPAGSKLRVAYNVKMSGKLEV